MRHFISEMFFRMASMPRKREGHSCGLVTNSVQGPEIVAAGGYNGGYLDTVDIYTVYTESWREGDIKLTP